MKLRPFRAISCTFLSIVLCSLLFIERSYAETNPQRLIFLPIQAENIETFEEAIFQNVIESELTCKFKLLSNDVIKASLKKNAAAACYTEKCLKKIATSLSCDLIGLGRVTYDSSGYTIGIEIKNIYTNEELFSELIPCSENSKSKTAKKIQLSEAISKMKNLAKKVCDSPLNFTKMSKAKPVAKKVINKKTKLKRFKPRVITKKPAIHKPARNSVSLVIDYTPLEFSSEAMSFNFTGLKYSYLKPQIGFLTCELFMGESSDSFYYGTPVIRQADGGSAIKIRAGYDYPFLGGKGGIDFVAGGGVEYMDIAIDIVNSGDASVTKTCIYADTGVIYITKKFIADFKLRFMLGDDDPDYIYGASLSAGMRF